jgi:tRNA U34 5-carboxymethylaminomethyl modifying GTPase MnmE/TrmE
MPASADTIAAIATPLGEGGIAMIRLSGPQSLAIADASFARRPRLQSRPLRPRTRSILAGLSGNGRVVDEVLLSVMRAPRTFTREDVVEITCHGGLLRPSWCWTPFWKMARAWPLPANSRGAPFSTAASIWPRPRRWPI